MPVFNANPSSQILKVRLNIIVVQSIYIWFANTMTIILSSYTAQRKLRHTGNMTCPRSFGRLKAE